jgi:hypothetical protein
MRWHEAIVRLLQSPQRGLSWVMRLCAARYARNHASAMLNRIAGVIVHERIQTATRQARTADLVEAGLSEATGCVKPAGCRVRYGQPWTGSEALFFGESSSGPGRSSDLDPTN